MKYFHYLRYFWISHQPESSNWKVLVTTARKPCTDYADISHAFSWKHVMGHLLWIRHDNADCEMPFVSLLTLWTLLGSGCLIAVNISQYWEQSPRVTWYLTYYDALHSWYMRSRTSFDNYPSGSCFPAETQLCFRKCSFQLCSWTQVDRREANEIVIPDDRKEGLERTEKRSLYDIKKEWNLKKEWKKRIRNTVWRMPRALLITDIVQAAWHTGKAFQQSEK